MKLRCLLVDDEPPALKVLSSYIANIQGMEIVGQCRNAIEALDLLHQQPVDVIFLDIKMPKILGTEFLKSLSVPPKVIFVSAYRDYAAEGYELDAVDYLVKPVSFERFIKAVSRLRRATGQHIAAPIAAGASGQEPFVYLKVDRDMRKVLVNDIVYIESSKDYVRLFFSDGKSQLVKQPISSMENLLSEHKFLRVHRSYMVSLDRISGFNNLCVKIGQQEIPIGRLYKKEVLERLQG